MVCQSEAQRVRDWLHIFSYFNVNFSTLRPEARYTFVEFSLTRQHYSEDLDVYVRRFHENALDCCDPVSEEMLVRVCLRGMTEKYRVFLESFPSFAKLIEAALGTKEFIRRSSKSNMDDRPNSAPAG